MISFSSNDNNVLFEAISFLSNRILLLSQLLALFLQKSFPDDEGLKKQINQFIHVIVEEEKR